MGRLLRRISTAFLLEKVQIMGRDGITVLKERGAEPATFANGPRLVSELFQEGDVMQVTADSYLEAEGKNTIGFSYKTGARKRLSFRFHLHFKEPEANSKKEAKRKAQADRTICSFFLTGCCRLGYTCPLKHIGLPTAIAAAAAAAAAGNANDNNAPDVAAPPPPPPPAPPSPAPITATLPDINDMQQAQAMLPRPGRAWRPPEKEQSAPELVTAAPAAEQAVEAVAGVVQVKSVEQAHE
jgi:hypothetical protein